MNVFLPMGFLEFVRGGGGSQTRDIWLCKGPLKTMGNREPWVDHGYQDNTSIRGKKGKKGDSASSLSNPLHHSGSATVGANFF